MYRFNRIHVEALTTSWRRDLGKELIVFFFEGPFFLDKRRNWKSGAHAPLYGVTCAVRCVTIETLRRSGITCQSLVATFLLFSKSTNKLLILPRFFTTILSLSVYICIKLPCLHDFGELKKIVIACKSSFLSLKSSHTRIFSCSFQKILQSLRVVSCRSFTWFYNVCIQYSIIIIISYCQWALEYQSLTLTCIPRNSRKNIFHL